MFNFAKASALILMSTIGITAAVIAQQSPAQPPPTSSTTDSAKAATDAAKAANDAAKAANDAAKAANDAAKAANDAAKAASDASKKATTSTVKKRMQIDKIVFYRAPLGAPWSMYADFISGDSEIDKTFDSVTPRAYPYENDLALVLDDVAAGDTCTFSVFMDTLLGNVSGNAGHRATGQFKVTAKGMKTFRFLSPPAGGSYYTLAVEGNPYPVAWQFTISWHLVD